MKRDLFGVLIPAGVLFKKELKQETELFTEARKFCKGNDCYAPFHCSNCKKTEPANPKIGDLQECPLAKYNLHLAHDTRTPEQKILDDVIVDDKAAQMLCATCSHATCTHYEFMVFLNRRADCVDCPVFYITEDIEELIEDGVITSKEQLIDCLENNELKEKGISEQEGNPK